MNLYIALMILVQSLLLAAYPLSIAEGLMSRFLVFQALNPLWRSPISLYAPLYLLRRSFSS